MYRIRFTSACHRVAWPSGLRRWIKAPVSSGAWVRIPPLPSTFCNSVSVTAKNALVLPLKDSFSTFLACPTACLYLVENPGLHCFATSHVSESFKSQSSLMIHNNTIVRS